MTNTRTGCADLRMRRANITYRLATATTVLLASTILSATANAGGAHPGSVIVQSALGGQIFGYDTDQNGTEGVITEAVTQNNLTNLIAIETFDQSTGKIVKIVKKVKNTYGDFVTLGVVGTSAGLIDYQREKVFLHRLPDAFEVIDPLDGNLITGKWTPSLEKREFILEVSEDQGSPTTAVLAYNDVIHPLFRSFVFGTNVVTNESGPKIELKDPIFSEPDNPVVALDAVTNDAIVAAGSSESHTNPELAVVDLTKSTVSQFAGLGAGEVNGIAIDSTDGIACTATQEDHLEFYNLATETGFQEAIQGATGDLQAGTDVQYDPVNHLFLILQPDCSQGADSCIEVYDTKGKWVEAVSGLTVANGLVTREHIAFNPNTRTGYIQSAPSELESFAY
jgi:hypothetical protein